MQTLYSLSSFEKAEMTNKRLSSNMLNEKLDEVLNVFCVAVLYPVRIAQYAESDNIKRSSKFLRTSEDMNVSIKIANNSFVQKLVARTDMTERVRKEKLDKFFDEDWVKKLYKQLSETSEYKLYTLSEGSSSADDKAIVKFIWEKLMLESEDVMSYFADELPGWEDNKDLILMLVDNFYSNRAKTDFSRLLTADKKEYAEELLQAVIEREEYCLELIAPKLVNWDKERVAVIDMLLLRMAICEFLYFPTIPTKVTINEYIDIAKQYSLPQSGQFVNGVLDNILKDLERENLIRKQDRNSK